MKYSNDAIEVKKNKDKNRNKKTINKMVELNRITSV